MEVYSPGTRVVLDEDISATIIGVTILAENVLQYQCAWWNGKSRSKDWIKPSEITDIDNGSKKIKIGFLQ